jgi:hypothetical protein
MALEPLNLFVTHNGRSSRQRVTCRYKCADACFHPVSNSTDGEYFGDIASAVSRRSVLQAAAVTVLAVGAGSALAACSRAESPIASPTATTTTPAAPPGMNFAAVPPNTDDAVVIPRATSRRW